MVIPKKTKINVNMPLFEAERALEIIISISAAVLASGSLIFFSRRSLERRKAKDIIRMVNSMYNLKQIEIMTPAELL